MFSETCLVWAFFTFFFPAPANWCEQTLLLFYLIMPREEFKFCVFVLLTGCFITFGTSRFAKSGTGMPVAFSETTVFIWSLGTLKLWLLFECEDFVLQSKSFWTIDLKIDVSAFISVSFHYTSTLVVEMSWSEVSEVTTGFWTYDFA